MYKVFTFFMCRQGFDLIYKGLTLYAAGRPYTFHFRPYITNTGNILTIA